MTRVAYRGLETGDRSRVKHVMRSGNVFFIFESALNPGDVEMGKWLQDHGDGVKDVAFKVDNVQSVYDYAVSHGAKSVKEVWEEEDEGGKVIFATVSTYGDTTHTLVQGSDDYKGAFLPNFAAVDGASEDPLLHVLPIPQLSFVDHCVGNQGDQQMVPVAEFYEKAFNFHRFWTVDDKMIHTEYSSLRSIVMTDYDEKVKMPINEPANGKRKSQIQEFVDYHNGAGVQHAALNVENILQTVPALKARGVKFLTIPKAYYKRLAERLAASPVNIAEDLAVLEEHNILVDFDDQGYLLQIFTKPLEDRPTFFMEIIQRCNHEGFGAGNFKALFESIEHEQAKRGNL